MPSKPAIGAATRAAPKTKTYDYLFGFSVATWLAEG